MVSEKDNVAKEEDKVDEKEREKELNNLKELLAKKNKAPIILKKINKHKVIKQGDIFKYEEVIENGPTSDKEKKKKSGKEEQRFKSNHSGDIIIEANVINKFKSKNRTCNTIKIASRINRTGIRVEKIKNIGFNRSEIKLLNKRC